jgi:hypothetical protein
MENFVTQHLKLSEIQVPYMDVLEKVADELLRSPSSPYRSESEIPFIRKFYGNIKASTEGLKEGQIRHIITSGALDRDHEILVPKGAVIKYYKQNRRVLWSHDYRDPDNIIAKNIDLQLLEQSRWEAITEFALKEHKAAKIYRLYKDDFLNMWSVGFIPVKGYRPKPEDEEKLAKLFKSLIILGEPPKPDEVRYVHEKWELLEYSAVAIGSNRDARTEAIAKKYDLDDALLKELEFKIKKAADAAGMSPENEPVIFDLAAGEGKNENGEQEKEDKAAAPEAADSKGEQKDVEDEYAADEELSELLAEEDTPPGPAREFIEDAQNAEDAPADGPKILENAQTLQDQAYETGEKDAEIITKPLPNFHSCRIRDPEKFKKGSIRTIQRDHEGKPYLVLIGRLKGETKTTVQGHRYPRDTWTAATARAHCKSHDGIRFEPAKEAGEIMVTREFYEDMKANIEGLREEITDMKAGRVLSAGTRQQIEDAIAAMGDAATALRAASRKLKGLLTLSDKPPEDESEEKSIEAEEKITLLLPAESDIEETEDQELELSNLDLNITNPKEIPLFKMDDLKALIKQEAAKINPTGALKEIVEEKKGKLI